MIVLSLSRRRPNRVDDRHRSADILPRLFLTQGFQSVCGVLKTVAIGLTLATAQIPAAHAQGMRVQEKVITDRWTGAAIGGFDPVAYFVDHRPVQGNVSHLLVQDGIAWHFQSESNLAAFQESPETYRPVFGGYDPVMVASGLPVAGYPHSLPSWTDASTSSGNRRIAISSSRMPRFARSHADLARTAAAIVTLRFSAARHRRP